MSRRNSYGGYEHLDPLLCPECKTVAVYQCDCDRRHARCPAGHWWHLPPRGAKSLLAGEPDGRRCKGIRGPAPKRRRPVEMVLADPKKVAAVKKRLKVA